MRVFRKLEVVSFISILMFLGAHCTELAFHADNIFEGIKNLADTARKLAEMVENA